MKQALLGLALTGAVTLLLDSTSAIAGEVHYRWLDDRGHPVHSDRPPPAGTDYEVVSTGSSLKREVEGEEGAVPREIKPRVGNEFEQVDVKQKVEKNPEFCARAQDNLHELDTRARIRWRDDDGEVKYLDEEERAVERQKALDAIEVYCE